MSSRTRRAAVRYPTVIAMTFLAVLVGGAIYIVAKEGSRAGAKAAASVVSSQLRLGCERNQLQRGYLQVRADQQKQSVRSPVTDYASDYFAIVDCGRTYADGHRASTVYVPPMVEACFLKLVQVGYWRHRDPFTDPQKLMSVCNTGAG